MLLQYSKAANCLMYQLTEDQIIPVLATIPEARRVNGSSVAVPLTLRHAQILKHLGHDVISPISTDYRWPGKYSEPRWNQKIVASFNTLHPRHFDVSDMRCGKTMSALWAADWLQTQGVIHKVLVLCTATTMKDVWETEVFSNFHGHRKATILHGTREKRLKNLKLPVDVYIINHDGIKVGLRRDSQGRRQLGALAAEIIAREDIDLIIIDEASAFKDSSTDRFWVLDHIIGAKPRAYVWGITGTPASKQPTDVWALGRLVYRKEGRPESFQTFRQRTMYRVSEFKWAAQKGAEQAVSNWLQPAVRYTRKQLGFPPLTFETRDVALTDAQKKAYAEMRKDLQYMTARGQKIDAVNEAVLRTKLMQIACGAVYDSDHVAHIIDAKPRLEALDDILEEANDKIIVFVPFTSVVDMITSYMSKKIGCVVIGEKTPPGARRDAALRDFRTDPKKRLLIGDSRSVAYGPNLSCADVAVFFGPIDSLEIYDQASARIDAPGQAGLVINLASSPVEREIYKRLQEKRSLQGAVLGLLENAL